MAGNADEGFLNFTGQHRTKFEQNNESILTGITQYVGLIVSSVGSYCTPLEINEALPCIELSTTGNDKRVFGAIAGGEEIGTTNRSYTQGSFITFADKLVGDDRIMINSLGEGGVWVCNKDGDLENGDFITTCSVPGYGTKQSDDLLHNYTFGKITQDTDFNNMGTTGVRYLDAVGNIISENDYDVLIGVTSSAYKAKFVGTILLKSVSCVILPKV